MSMVRYTPDPNNVFEDFHIKDRSDPGVRFEQKFAIDNISAEALTAQIRLHWATFVEAYPIRDVNNVYFDTETLSNYWENVIGCTKRQKIRLRWYGAFRQELDSPVLELKVRRNTFGLKHHFELRRTSIRNLRNRGYFSQLLRESQVPEVVTNECLTLRPVLMNRYRRRYFVSRCYPVRLTLDERLCFYRYSDDICECRNTTHNPRCVVEIKYAPCMDQEGREISSTFRFRHTKSSKYVVGIDRLRAQGLL